ncbi:MAG TPA: hypothetical protein VFC93_00025 [Chloroflexota bacterium]|nr:hypothetical protein [Chloroflexota bacterium]
MCGYLGIDWRAVAAGLASAVLLCAFAVVVPTIPSATVLTVLGICALLDGALLMGPRRGRATAQLAEVRVPSGPAGPGRPTRR